MKLVAMYIAGSLSSFAILWFLKKPTGTQLVCPKCASCPAETVGAGESGFKYEIYNSVVSGKMGVSPALTPFPSPDPTPVKLIDDQDRKSTAKQKTNIVFTDEIIGRMENAWNGLPSQMLLQREEKGWRIVSLKSGSLFSEVGLNVGDFISDASVQALQYTDSSNEQLSDRLTAILKRVANQR